MFDLLRNEAIVHFPRETKGWNLTTRGFQRLTSSIFTTRVADFQNRKNML